MADADEVLRATPSPTVANDWSLVLASSGIAHRVVEQEGAFALVVAAGDRAAAVEALAAFDAESVPVPEVPAPDRGASALGLAVALILGAFYVVAGNWEADVPSAWFTHGAASAELLRRGQVWRVVTTLTLHQD